MNKSTLKTAALSLLIGLGALSAMPAAANAAGVYFEFGNGPRAGAGFRADGHRDFRRHHAGPRFCTPGHAVRKASRMGVHRAEVVRAGYRRVVVEGFRHHRPVRVVFANESRCPVIGVHR